MKTGQLYRFDGGDKFPGPKGEFDHDDNVSEVKTAEKKPDNKPTDKNTVTEIKKYLEANDIDFDDNSKKAELLELV